MARELKVFGTLIMARGDETASLGMAGHHRQIRAIVATTTKKEAIEKLGLNSSGGRDFLTETGNDDEIKLATSKPGQVFAFEPHRSKSVYIEITRKAHVPFKRSKRLTYEEQKALRDQAEAERAKRKFTNEELEYLVDLLTGANNPVGASIAERAALILNDRKETK